MKTITINPGNRILCDLCNKDWTDSKQTGGFLFESKAVCPDCEPKLLEMIMENEEGHLAKCPKNMAFADWVRNYLR